MSAIVKPNIINEKSYSFYTPFSAVPVNAFFTIGDKVYIKFSDEQDSSDNIRTIAMTSKCVNNAYCNVYSLSSGLFTYIKPDEICFIIKTITFTQE